MRQIMTFMLVPVLALTAACGRDDSAQIDEALRNDLALASSMQPYQPQQFVSPMEQGYAGYQGYAPMQPQQYNAGYYNPAPAPRAQTPRRVSTAGTYSRPAPAPAPTRVVKHTKRDAIIGAAAGAAIGAVTSSDKLKGAVIGAAAGGLLGAVIGNNVDKKRVPY
jgi:hypothetical protein